MSKSCSGILDEYINCVADSPCVKVCVACTFHTPVARTRCSQSTCLPHSGPRPAAEGLRQGRRRGAGVHSEARGVSRSSPQRTRAAASVVLFVGPTHRRKPLLTRCASLCPAPALLHVQARSGGHADTYQRQQGVLNATLSAQHHGDGRWPVCDGATASAAPWATRAAVAAPDTTLQVAQASRLCVCAHQRAAVDAACARVPAGRHCAGRRRQ